MKILVTGATGFVGQHVVNYLLTNGYDVVATATSQKKAGQCAWFGKATFVEYVIGRNENGGEDPRNLFAYFHQPDLLIHLAWQGLPNYKASFHIDKNLFVHYLFLKNLIRNGLTDVSVTGTCFEYGMQSGCLAEDVPGSGIANPYALAKDSLRRFLDVLQLEHPFVFKWIRLFYMYGAGQSRNALIPLLDQAIDQGDATFNMSGGEQLRDYLPIDAVARYVGQIALQQQVTGIINCCSGRPISVRRLVEEHMQRRQATIHLNLGYYPYPDYEPMAFWGDATRLAAIRSATHLL